jgi:VIT1/CCC1 family predicted Fe2+/Mn2+ transporter
LRGDANMKHTFSRILMFVDKIIGITMGLFFLAALSVGYGNDPLEAIIMLVIFYSAIRIYVK